jgi:hypothetical protein
MIFLILKIIGFCRNILIATRIQNQVKYKMYTEIDHVIDL